MTIIDRNGRLFGRINLFDAAALIGMLVTVALAVVGYRLLKLPPAPRVTEVTPTTVTAAPDMRVTIKGENLLPYMRVYLQRTSQPTQVMHEISRWVRADSYTLANAARAIFRVESPTLAEVSMLEPPLPGTYDIIFYDEVKIVGIQQAAFTVVAPPKPAIVSSDREAMLRVHGSFIGLTRAVADTMKGGAAILGDTERDVGQIVSAQAPTADMATVDIGGPAIDVAVLDRWRVPADLRLRCTVAPGKCFFNEAPLVVGRPLALRVDGTVKIFIVNQLSPDVVERARLTDVTVRFLARSSMVPLVQVGDVDTSPGPGGPDDVPARITAVQRGADTTADLNENGSLRTLEKAATLECVLKMPLVHTPAGWVYRSQAIKAGASIVFQTEQYLIRGVVEGVAVARATRATVLTP